jgi:hypothetical protein
MGVQAGSSSSGVYKGKKEKLALPLRCSSDLWTGRSSLSTINHIISVAWVSRCRNPGSGFGITFGPQPILT